MSSRDLAKHIRVQYEAAARRSGGGELRALAVGIALSEYGIQVAKAHRFLAACGLHVTPEEYEAVLSQTRQREVR